MKTKPENSRFKKGFPAMEERRKASRLEKNFPIKIVQIPGKDFDLSTETKNISASGAYCGIDQPIELMTKLKLTLLFSLPGPKTKKIKKIDCEGVVVRKEKSTADKKHPYRIAIFFSNLKNQDRKFLQSHINSFSGRL